MYKALKYTNTRLYSESFTFHKLTDDSHGLARQKQEINTSKESCILSENKSLLAASK